MPSVIVTVLLFDASQRLQLWRYKRHGMLLSAQVWMLQVPGVYTDAYSDAALTYASTSYLDDMAYAAAWMYYATKVSARFGPCKHSINLAMQLLQPVCMSWLVAGQQCMASLLFK